MARRKDAEAGRTSVRDWCNRFFKTPDKDMLKLYELRVGLASTKCYLEDAKSLIGTLDKRMDKAIAANDINAFSSAYVMYIKIEANHAEMSAFVKTLEDACVNLRAGMLLTQLSDIINNYAKCDNDSSAKSDFQESKHYKPLYLVGQDNDIRMVRRAIEMWEEKKKQLEDKLKEESRGNNAL